MTDSGPPRSNDDLEAKKLRLEYRKLRQEKLLKERELEIERENGRRGQWNTPMLTALIAGSVGLFGTVWNGCQGVESERRKQEGTLIVEAIKTGTNETGLAAANLLFLSNAGLIRLDSGQRKALESKVGTQNPLPALPKGSGSVAFEPSGALTPEVQELLQGAVARYEEYLLGLGYQPPRQKIVVALDSSLTNNIYYSVRERRLVVGAIFSTDTEAVLNQYTLAVLSDAIEVTSADSLAQAIPEIAQGLADYFASSYTNDPVVGEVFVSLRGGHAASDKPYLRNLANQRNFRERGGAPTDRGEIWGGAFWEMRQRLTPKVADKLLYNAWASLGATRDRDAIGYFFLRRILEADQRLFNGTHQIVIQDVFRRRGLQER